MIFNNEDTCFCSDGYYGNSCENSYRYDKVNITISNCENTSCFNGNLIYYLFFIFILNKIVYLKLKRALVYH